MEEFIKFKETCELVALPSHLLVNSLIIKTFPLPVKDKKGEVVFVKSEVDNWMENKARKIKKRREKLNGRTDSKIRP